MLQKILSDYCPSVLLSSVLVAGVIVFLKRIFCLEVDQVHALISIIFGLVALFFLLACVWISRNKHFSRRWSDPSVSREILSMHPRGRTDSLHDHSNQAPLSILATRATEQPPSYEDALANSKPLSAIRAHYSENSNRTKEISKDLVEQQNDRKVSLIQLDVNQLIRQEAPPKYYELHEVVVSKNSSSFTES